MTSNNTPKEINISKNDSSNTYTLEHLYSLSISIPQFEFEDGRVDAVHVNVRPTNHVYSRSTTPTDDIQAFQKTGELILKLEHYRDDPQQIKTDGQGKTKTDSEARIFCPEKYEQSKLLPTFIEELNERPNKISVLPNRGDARTCLSALIQLSPPYAANEYFLVFFTLHKKRAASVNMVIETAFVVSEPDFRVRLLTESKNQHQRRPFIVLLKNTLAGRLPFESAPQKARKKKTKRKARNK
ncbi:hypothetical protein [Marinobacter sp.]|uniref:hypothetical protein n=1 Tax=Marinobacter sp. TaxID=50741 RepID=UPI003A917273